MFWKLSRHMGRPPLIIGSYPQAAQAIFQGALSFTVRAPIQAGHRMLYARTTSSTFGIINDSDGFWALFRAGDDRPPADPLLAQQKAMEESRIKPAVYTYVIGEDDNFRFSETGASFFVDFASKHALHRYLLEYAYYHAVDLGHFQLLFRDSPLQWRIPSSPRLSGRLWVGVVLRRNRRPRS